MRVPNALRVAVATHYWAPHVGGIETVARQQAEHFARRGIDVEVHTARLPRTAPARSRWSPHVEGGDVEGGEVRVLRHGAVDPLAKALQVPVPLPGLRLARALLEAARRCDVVIAHGHSYPSSMLAAAGAKRAGRPFVLVQHSPWVAYGRPLDSLERAVDRTLGRAVIRAADRVVCVSEHTAEYVRSIDPAAVTVVVPNGVDTRRFHPLDEPWVARVSDGDDAAGQRPAVLLFVGRMVRRNGWQVLLDAWRMADLGGRAELHVVGSGPDDAAVRDAAVELDDVRILGRVDDSELVERYRSAHVVVVPSTTGEGFGLVAAEALACGTPVVASAQGGLTEVVRHGQDGLLVTPGDPVALSVALRRLLDDTDLHATLARGARARDLSQERAAEALLDVIRHVIRDVAPGRVDTSGASWPATVGSA